MPHDVFDCSPARIPVYRRRIYHADTDAAGIVHHSRYLAILEEARTEWIAGIDDDEFAAFRRGDKAMAVISTRQRFLQPIRLGRIAEVSCRITEVGKVRLIFAYAIAVDGACCHEAEICVACVDARVERLCPVPQLLRKFNARENARRSCMQPAPGHTGA
ncbi:acyl-CoA thioesterase [Burkholderia cepacia]|uniref:acyl-CoA thioesterase n=1 Tax=Burkholderia cepacia TaxID=292 RepID=UPI0015773418|nr:thioesterase family protein [Burkholderia cepacia]NTX20454.1 acyl-CoA thioesterase [Burkholderia cepacia]